MSAGVYDIIIEQGSTFAFEITLTSDGTHPIVLTDYLGRGMIRHHAADLEPMASFTVTILDALTGKIGIYLSAEDSSAIPLKGYGYDERTVFYYDIEIYKDDEVIRVLNGQAQISPEITK